MPCHDGASRSPVEVSQVLTRVARAAARPLEQFLRIEAASGIVLLLAGAVAFAWANSPWARLYQELWALRLRVTLGPFSLQPSLAWLVNDGLMAIFFFVVGLEIRRELQQGELSTWRKAALPVVAAAGGMVAPALFYLGIAHQPATRSGWGTPMATDIAFALAVFALLATRVPAALRVLLLGLAVIDDLGAIAVVGLFYSSGLDLLGLGVAAAGLGAVLALQRLGVRVKLAYLVPALVVWGGVGAAGIHPTIAGVVLGLLTPVERSDGTSPAGSLIEMLHPWVAFGIMPIFALVNAGVPLPSGAIDAASGSVLVGVIAGLLLGKPLGVLAATTLALRLGLVALPTGLTTRHLILLGTTAGVGFTMALFIAQLAFVDASLLGAARLGILVASVAAALLSLGLGRLLLKRPAPPEKLDNG